MRVLSIVHERAAGSGVFANAARERRDELTEWVPAHQPLPAPGRFDAAIVFGGAMHADEESAHDWLRLEKELLQALLAADVPTLGVCLGAQLLAEVAGGAVTRMDAPEIGWTRVALTPAARADAVILAHSRACVQAFRLVRAPWWGIQFHAEATRETIAAWIDDYRSDQDAVRAQLDWGVLLEETAQRIDSWNELGTGICTRFLDNAELVARD